MRTRTPILSRSFYLTGAKIFDSTEIATSLVHASEIFLPHSTVY